MDEDKKYTNKDFLTDFGKILWNFFKPLVMYFGFVVIVITSVFLMMEALFFDKPLGLLLSLFAIVGSFLVAVASSSVWQSGNWIERFNVGLSWSVKVLKKRKFNQQEEAQSKSFLLCWIAAWAMFDVLIIVVR